MGKSRRGEEEEESKGRGRARGGGRGNKSEEEEKGKAWRGRGARRREKEQNRERQREKGEGLSNEEGSCGKGAPREAAEGQLNGRMPTEPGSSVNPARSNVASSRLWYHAGPRMARLGPWRCPWLGQSRHLLGASWVQWRGHRKRLQNMHVAPGGATH